MKNSLKSLGITLAVLLSFLPFQGSAETIKGISFTVPIGFQAIPNLQKPAVAGWIDEEKTVSLTVIEIPHNEQQLRSLIQELREWPSAGRAMIHSFGKSNASALEKALTAQCSYTGSPENLDSTRAAMRVAIEVTCENSFGTETFIYKWISVLTKSSQIGLRVEAEKAAKAKFEEVAASIWNTLSTERQQAVQLSVHSDNGSNSGSEKSSGIRGGRGTLTFRDYSQVRPEILVAELIGAMLGAILGGFVLAWVLMKLGIPPIYSLISGQVIIAALAVWGSEHNGAWTLDPLRDFATGIVAFLLLRGWATRTWTKRSRKIA